MKNLLKQEGISESRNHCKTVTQRTSRSQRQLAIAPQFFREVRTNLVLNEGDYVEPKTVYEAKQGDDWEKWHRAMKDKVKSLQDNEIWNLVRPPTHRDVIPGK